MSTGSGYRILARLGAGGMAEVYRAVLRGPHGTQKPCVVKRIAPQHADDARYRQLFLDEARVSMLLNHPNLVQAFELGEQDGGPFLALELVDGVSLSTLLSAHAKAGQLMPVGAALRIAAGVARGLAYAHRLTDLEGVPLLLTHRDVSPQNILLSRDGAVKLADFGIALHELRDYVTIGPGAKGKPGYMAPEQAMGVRVDGRADVFALGVVLTEMLSRSRVGAQSTVSGLVERIARLSRAHPESREDVVALIAAMTEPDRDERIATADEAAERLEALAQQVGPPIDLGALVRAHTRAPDPATEVPLAPPSDTESEPSQDAPHWSAALGSAGELEFSITGTAEQSVPSLELTRPAPPAPTDGGRLVALSTRADPGATTTPRAMGTEPRLEPRLDGRRARTPSRSRLLLGGAVGVSVLLLGGGYLLRPAPPPLRGTLSVTSEPPGAQVVIDDVEVGQVTPAVIADLALGRALRVEVRRTGWLAVPRQLLVEPTDRARAPSASFALTPARVVRVESVPAGASVRIGDRPALGVTPLSLPPLPLTESATLTLELRGYLGRALVVHAGTATVARAELERARLIVLESTPDGARAFVDGVAVGETPVREVEVPAARSFLLRVERRGYQRWQRTVTPRQLRGDAFAVSLVELPILGLPLTDDQRQVARALLDERKRLRRALSYAQQQLEVAKATRTKVAGVRQRFVSVTVDAEAAVADAEARLDEARDALDQVEGELETLRDQVTQP